MNIKGQLFAGCLDVVGDIHGEFDALQDLLGELGYAEDGTHPQGRKLVFVGDLIDRGPDSPAVVEKVMRLVESGRAQCVLGNHELNILRDDKKSENAWFFTESGYDCSAMKPASDEQRSRFRLFFERLPLVLERDDLRVVHACWNDGAITELESGKSEQSVKAAIFAYYRARTDRELRSNGQMADYELEQQEYRRKIRYGNNEPTEHWPDARMLPASAIVHEKQQMENPIAVLTSGEERVAETTYPAGGKFRFVQRIGWWDDYRDDKAVVVGHYWRAFNRGVLEELRESGEDLFFGIAPNEWLGPNKNVFCIDFCVGARALARKDDASCDGLKLGALRWPDRELVFHDGEKMQSIPCNDSVRAPGVYDAPTGAVTMKRPRRGEIDEQASAAASGTLNCYGGMTLTFEEALEQLRKWQSVNEAVSRRFEASKVRFREILPMLDALHSKAPPDYLRIEVSEIAPDMSAILYAGNLAEQDGTRFRWEVGPSHDADGSPVWFLSTFDFGTNNSDKIEVRNSEDLRVNLITKVAEEVAYQSVEAVKRAASKR